MRHTTLLSLVLLFPVAALAQRPDSQQGSSSQEVSGSGVVQVIYVIDDTSIVTYNIDPQTLDATQVGILPVAASNAASLVTSTDGHFLYYRAYDDPAEASQHLWVYMTDAKGAPQNPPVQKISTNNLFWSLSVDPTDTFLYAVFAHPNGDGYKVYKIRRYLVDRLTGRLSRGEVEAKYVLPNNDQYCELAIVGFSGTGNKMYDKVDCSNPHGDANATYNERQLDLRTGKLGLDIRVYSWDNSSGGGENVQFVKNKMFDFVIPNDYQQGEDSVNIYPLQPGTKTPLLQCTAEMLEACGYGGGVAHPSGNYVFMRITPDATQIGKVEWKKKRIVDTSYYIPYSAYQFSPDGSLVYGLYYLDDEYFVEIYGFDVATSKVTPGGAIRVPSQGDPFFIAQRY